MQQKPFFVSTYSFSVRAAALAGASRAGCSFSVGWRPAGGGGCSIAIIQEFFASIGGILILRVGLSAGRQFYELLSFS